MMGINGAALQNVSPVKTPDMILFIFCPLFKFSKPTENGHAPKGVLVL
jgi:hypothetical protein